MTNILRHGDDLLNTITYMVNEFGQPSANFSDHKFLGFVPVANSEYDRDSGLDREEYGWGFDHDGVNYVAAHLTKILNGHHWGDDPQDTEHRAITNPWALMYLGTDNSSWFQRFPTEDKALQFYNDHAEITNSDLMYYNS